MRYLILLIFISCNSEMKEREVEHEVNVAIVDSLTLAFDSLKTDLKGFYEVSDYAKEAQARIKKLESEKKQVQFEIGEQPVSLAMQSNDYKPSDDKDKRIYELTQKVRAYEMEIAVLKNRLFYDSMGKVSKNYDIVPNEEKPNDKSLVVILNKKLRGDGDISEQGVSVWIMKYTKKAKKAFKGYDNCQQKDLNLLDAKEASYYKGQYFFNDIEPGEYLIKVCALYGNWMVINKKDYKQEIEILMSPPIQ